MLKQFQSISYKKYPLFRNSCRTDHRKQLNSSFVWLLFLNVRTLKFLFLAQIIIAASRRSDGGQLLKKTNVRNGKNFLSKQTKKADNNSAMFSPINVPLTTAQGKARNFQTHFQARSSSLYWIHFSIRASSKLNSSAAARRRKQGL